MRRTCLPCAVAAAAVLACSSGPPAPHAVGDESFVSPVPGSGGRLAGEGGAPTGSPAPADAPSGARVVEEADIYRLDGARLLVLNAYRGLQIVDLADPARPALRSRVPVEGTPV